MKPIFYFSFILISLSACSQSKKDNRHWVQLFNGKNLDGWVMKISKHELGDNFGNTFRVENGLLKVSYDQYKEFDQQFGHLFYKKPFSHYIIAVEYRFVGEQCKGGPDWAWKNSGVMLHCQPPQTMLKDQDFPISIEEQLLGGHPTGERSTANLCTPGTNVEMNGKLFTPHCINSSSPTFRGTEWVRVEALVWGGEYIKHIVNGDTVLSYQKPQIGGGNVIHYDSAYKKDGQILTQGYISLQSESHPIEFRKVEILILDEKAGEPPFKQVAVLKRKACACAGSEEKEGSGN